MKVSALDQMIWFATIYILNFHCGAVVRLINSEGFIVGQYGTLVCNSEGFIVDQYGTLVCNSEGFIVGQYGTLVCNSEGVYSRSIWDFSLQ